MKIAIAIALMAIASPGLSMTLEDPAGFARQLSAQFPPQAGHGFTCDTPVRFSQGVYRCDIQCEKNPCRTECRPSNTRSFVMQAEGCGGEELEIVSDLAWLTRASTTAPKKFGQTWLEEFLTSTDFFVVPSGAMVIKYVLPGRNVRLVDESGDEVPLETIVVLLDYRQVPGGPGINFKVILDKNKTGLDQLLFFGQDDRRDYFLKKWGLLL